MNMLGTPTTFDAHVGGIVYPFVSRSKVAYPFVSVVYCIYVYVYTGLMEGFPEIWMNDNNVTPRHVTVYVAFLFFLIDPTSSVGVTHINS